LEEYMTKELKNFVGGEFVDTQNGSVSELVNPSTGEVFATAPISGAADLDRAYGVAAKAFESWKNSTPSERQQALLTIADTFEAHAQELVDIESENTGKPIPVTMEEELPPMIDQIKFFAGAARILEGKAAGEYMSGFTSMVRREPIGVIGQVTPWNYPMMMAVWKFIPAIAAGNTVVLKPSDTTPASTLKMAELRFKRTAAPATPAAAMVMRPAASRAEFVPLPEAAPPPAGTPPGIPSRPSIV
jgi:betaine-aldehyde dehydrogenase